MDIKEVAKWFREILETGCEPCIFCEHTDLKGMAEACERFTWRPIETAPRDGTEIFLWQSDHTVPVVAHWYWFGDRELMQGCWVANKSFYSAEHSVVEDDTDTKYVTHWMPLPDAPQP